MALNSTIFKANLQIADMDRNYYADHQLTLARHPSETDERMMVRLLAFVLHAHERLSFTRGLCDAEEPALWLKSYSDEIELWIDVGQPDENRIRKACNRSADVCVYLYGGRGADVWWANIANKLSRYRNLSVFEIPEVATQAMAGLVQRSMQLQCTIQDGDVYLTAGDQSCTVSPQLRMHAGA